MAQDFADVFTSQVNIGGFSAHSLQQTCFVLFPGKIGQWDPAAVGRKSPYNPVASDLNERIATARCTTDDGLIQDLARAAAIPCPEGRGGNERLCLPRHPAAIPIRQRHVSLATQA